MMRNYFWFGTTIPEFLFDGFDIKTPAGFVSMCFGLLSLAFLLERIKLYQKYSRCKIVVREAINSDETTSEIPRGPETHTSCVISYDSHGHQETTPILNKNDYNPKPTRPRPLEQFADTASFTVVEILNYTLMLCAMLYNGFFVISIVLGSSFGYFLFGQRAYELTVIASSIEQTGKENQPTEAEEQGREMLSVAVRDMLNVVSNISNTASSIEESSDDNQEEHGDHSEVLVHAVNA